MFQNLFILHDHFSNEMISNMDKFNLPMIFRILSIKPIQSCYHNKESRAQKLF